MTLIRLWTMFGNVSLAAFAGAAWAVAVMNQWYVRVDRHGWDGVTAPDGEFTVYIAIAFGGAVWLARAVYRWAARRIEAHDARVLKGVWIDRRKQREMRDVTRRK